MAAALSLETVSLQDVTPIIDEALQAAQACDGTTVILAFVLGVLIGWPTPRPRWMRNGHYHEPPSGKPPSS